MIQQAIRSSSTPPTREDFSPRSFALPQKGISYLDRSFSYIRTQINNFLLVLLNVIGLSNLCCIIGKMKRLCEVNVDIKNIQSTNLRWTKKMASSIAYAPKVEHEKSHLTCESQCHKHRFWTQLWGRRIRRSSGPRSNSNRICHSHIWFVRCLYMCTL